MAAGFAALGVIGALVFIYQVLSLVDSDDDIEGLYVTPILFGVGGWILGFSLAVLFAPKSYLQSPAARKWLGVVGTNSISTARAVCAVVASLAMIFFGGLIWALIVKRF
ncbi:MAG: hypothetical protein KDA85_09890 [Planctomycetaceae bacterium]|nr:hypothetical protein [Planctomycetaceae bacterium]